MKRYLGRVMLGAFLLIAAAMTLFCFLLRRSEVTRLALTAASGDERLNRTIGKPWHAGYFVLGNIEWINDGGAAKLIIPVSGPLRGGTLLASELRVNGIWHVESVSFAYDGRTPAFTIYPAPANQFSDLPR